MHMRVNMEHQRIVNDVQQQPHATTRSPPCLIECLHPLQGTKVLEEHTSMLPEREEVARPSSGASNKRHYCNHTVVATWEKR
jgi:hypothetical protein